MDPCSDCGSTLPEGASFCPSCGTRVANRSPSASAPRRALRYFSEDAQSIGGECPHCRRVWKVSKERVREARGGFSLGAPLECSCGRRFDGISLGASRRNVTYDMRFDGDEGIRKVDDGPVRCPKCSSTRVTAHQRGFDALKGAGGVVGIGPIGFLAGFFGSNRLVVTCLKCGNSWKTP